MSPAGSCVAMMPIAVYLIVIGTINLRRRAFVTTAVRDMAALGIALSGLVLIGPVRLFFPAELIAGPLQWGLVTAMYFSTLVLLLLFARPRVVVYNVSAAQLHPVLTEVLQSLDLDVRRFGEVLSLPNKHVHFRVQSFPLFRNISLVATEQPQDFRSWRELQAALARALADVPVPVNPRGVSLTAIGTALAAIVTVLFLMDAQGTAREILQLIGVQ
ncbi:MAG: hypothetical protein HYS13_24615 [Planctomycetia bacterium]|nr:hypothetical protein [Planctomycetia bacterium]